MEGKITEAINHVRSKNRQRVTSERIFNHITKAKASIYQGQLMKVVQSLKDNGVIFNKPKGKRESTFLTNKTNSSWIITNKLPAKVKTVTSRKLTSPSTSDEISLFDNAILTSKKQQPSTTPILATPKTLTYKATESSR